MTRAVSSAIRQSLHSLPELMLQVSPERPMGEQPRGRWIRIREDIGPGGGGS